MVERLLSCFQIAKNCDKTIPLRHRRKEMLRTCSKNDNLGVFSRLKLCKNKEERFYEENHLEEWISREPSSIFQDQKVMIVASQNYVFLQERIDILFLNQNCEFVIVELKVEPVVRTGVVTPYKIYDEQMEKYVKYVQRASVFQRFHRYYSRFSAKFYGSTRNLYDQINDVLAGHVQGNTAVSARIHEVYVSELFDEYAVDYILDKGRQDGRNVRLIRYKFYPQSIDQNDYIEFWEVLK